MNKLFKHFRWKRSKTSENSQSTFVINRFRHMRGAFGWQIYYAFGDGQWYLFSNQMLQLLRTTNYIRQHGTLSSLNTLKICTLSVSGHFFLTSSPTIKTAFFKPDVIVKTMYRISPDRRIPVRIDISIYWFTPSYKDRIRKNQTNCTQSYFPMMNLSWIDFQHEHVKKI